VENVVVSFANRPEAAGCIVKTMGYGPLLGCPTSSAQSEYFAYGMVEKSL
jgi:hypothetical protein